MKDVLVPLLGFVLGGGLVGSLVALVKVGPERDAIVVTASRGALQNVLDALDKATARAERAEERVTQLEQQVSEMCRRIRDLERHQGGASP